MAVTYFLLRSRTGLALKAIRDNDLAAESSGVNLWRTKLYTYVIAGAGCALVGAIVAIHLLRVQPAAAFSINWTAYLIFITVIGGIGTIEGPIIGTLIYFVLRETTSKYGEWYFIVLGLLAIVVAIWSPAGIYGYIVKKDQLLLLPAAKEGPIPGDRQAGRGDRGRGRSLVSSFRIAATQRGRPSGRPLRFGGRWWPAVVSCLAIPAERWHVPLGGIDIEGVAYCSPPSRKAPGGRVGPECPCRRQGRIHTGAVRPRAAGADPHRDKRRHRPEQEHHSQVARDAGSHGDGGVRQADGPLPAGSEGLSLGQRRRQEHGVGQAGRSPAGGRGGRDQRDRLPGGAGRRAKPCVSGVSTAAIRSGSCTWSRASVARSTAAPLSVCFWPICPMTVGRTWSRNTSSG